MFVRLRIIHLLYKQPNFHFSLAGRMGSFSNITDGELVVLIQQGNVQAFAEVYNRYWDKLYNSAHKRLNNQNACEEIVQDVFTKYWAKKDTLLITTGLSNYLQTAIKYSVIDFYRAELTKTKFLDANKHQVPTDNSNEENIYLQDLKKMIAAAVETLPTKCKQVYELSRVEHKTNKEIAVLLDISEKTVEGHLTKALQILRNSIKDAPLVASLFFLKNFF